MMSPLVVVVKVDIGVAGAQARRHVPAVRQGLHQLTEDEEGCGPVYPVEVLDHDGVPRLERLVQRQHPANDFRCQNVDMLKPKRQNQYLHLISLWNAEANEGQFPGSDVRKPLCIDLVTLTSNLGGS